jgi:hypothetical protein
VAETRTRAFAAWRQAFEAGIGYCGRKSVCFLGARHPHLRCYWLGASGGINQDGVTVHTAATLAKDGERMSLYATDEGQTTPAGVNGKPASVPIPTPIWVWPRRRVARLESWQD